MDYLFNEYGTLILECIAAMLTLYFVIELFVVVVTGGNLPSQNTSIIYKTINLFIHSLAGSV